MLMNYCGTDILDNTTHSEFILFIGTTWLQAYCSCISLTKCFRRGSFGMLPLHMASLGGFTDCCKKLISYGEAQTYTVGENKYRICYITA